MELIFGIILGVAATTVGMMIAELHCLRYEIREAEKNNNKPEDK